MPWPEPVGVLLAKPDCRASQALRWGLRGLQASLQATLTEVPDDPGSTELRDVLAEIGALIESAASTSAPSLPLETAQLPSASDDVLVLQPLADAVKADLRFQEMLRNAPLRVGSDEEIWNDVQRLLLRTPPDLAREWRGRSLTIVSQLGARADASRAAVLPLGQDEGIYPGLTGAVEATGLRSSKAATFDPRVNAPADVEQRDLAGVISAWLWFIERDPNLRHALQSVFRFGLTPLTGEQGQRYQAELLRRWERVRTGRLSLKDRLDLDEAIHSLVYQPQADPSSWWGRLQAQARATLFQARDQEVLAGRQVHVQLLGGNFAEINRLAPDSLEVDYGLHGEVIACLRVWARIDGEELKGRVLYRPPLEEP